MKKYLFTAILLLCVSLPVLCDDIPNILPLRERAEVVNKWLMARLERVVPELMRREGIDMWVIISREYNEDPVIMTMLPAPSMAARRRTILIFFDRGAEEGVERLAVSRYSIGKFFKGMWSKEEQPDQWKAVADIVVERDPKKIALDYSKYWGHADGIDHTEYLEFVETVGETYASRIVSGEQLAVGWLETRIEEELVVYPQIVRIAHEIIAEGLSDKVITPGITATADVQWYYRQRILDLGLATWFQPSVSVQRADSGKEGHDYTYSEGPQVIMPGDLIHIDFGIEYLRLHTDTQQNAYVLRPGETDAPEGLKHALAVGNRLQDIHTAEFAVGRTGNEALKTSLEKAKAEGIRPSIYSHPLGLHGHAAGTVFGLWDQQWGVEGTGDHPLHASTCYAIELNVAVNVPEWGKDVVMALEESACFDGEKVWYLDGRQTKLHLINGCGGINAPE